MEKVKIAEEKKPEGIDSHEIYDEAPEKEKREDPLREARPTVRERLMAAGMQRAGTLAEHGALVFGGKALDLYERMKGYPSLKRERAQQAADECERALEENSKDLVAYGDDSERLQKLRSDREGMERQLVDARLELGKRKTKEEQFQSRKRSFEGGMRTYASGVLEKINKHLAPFERELTVARTIVERSGADIGAIKKNIDAYKADLAEKRGTLASVTDPVERKNIELEIQRIDGALSSNLPTIDRMVKKREAARKVLEFNEGWALPYRQQQRRFARAAGLEVREDILTKGTPPEDLPVMPRGKSRVIEVGASKAKEAKQKGVFKIRERLAARKEAKKTSSTIDGFITEWNKEVALDGWRIKDAKYFKYLIDGDEYLTQKRAAHIARKYFEDKATRNGRVLTPGQYRKAERIGRRIADKVFPNKRAS